MSDFAPEITASASEKSVFERQGDPAVPSALRHAHFTPFTPPSSSVRLAVKSMRTLGCSEEKVIVPTSSALVTVMTTSRVAVSFFESVATTVTMYMLSMLASVGASKLGESMNLSIALEVGVGVP